jgi:hypothetical protein
MVRVHSGLPFSEQLKRGECLHVLSLAWLAVASSSLHAAVIQTSEIVVECPVFLKHEDGFRQPVIRKRLFYNQARPFSGPAFSFAAFRAPAPFRRRRGAETRSENRGQACTLGS